MSTATLITAEQFAQMQFGETEDYELVNGELNPLPSGTPLHNLIRDSVGYVLRDYLRQRSGGLAIVETECRLSSLTVRRPGISVFLGDHASGIDLRRTPVPFAPDIAVEILSPSEAAINVSRKALEYTAAGCREVWIVDHENGEVSVRTNSGLRLLRGNDRLESPLLPGFSQPVADLLAW